MKKILIVGVLAVVSAVAAMAQDAVSAGRQDALARARGQIDKIIETPDLMKTVMAGLSAEEQKQFVADVNKAIGDMPASVEERTAKFLNVNHAAVVSAAKGNKATILAEVFATVPPEALTILNERFATDLMSRSANPNITYTDEQYTKICLELMEKINERTEETDNGSTRSAFAILMLVRASNGTPEDLADKLIDTLKHDDAKELAKTEWVPAALGKDGREQGYEPILASADAGSRPDFAYVLVIAGPQYLESILHDIGGKNMDRYSFIRTRSPVLDAVENPLVHQVPTLHDEPFGGDAVAPLDPVAPLPPVPPAPPAPPAPPHPDPYPWTSRL